MAFRGSLSRSLLSAARSLSLPRPGRRMSMAFRGSLSRSLLSAARSSLRSSPPLHRPPPVSAPRLHRRRGLSFSPPRVGELGCVQSLLPLHSAVVAGLRLTSHPSANVRAFCELSQGT